MVNFKYPFLILLKIVFEMLCIHILFSVAPINITKSNLRKKWFLSSYTLWYTIKRSLGRNSRQELRQELNQRS